MIGPNKAEALGAQLFRRIGYTNALANLLRMGEVCTLVGDHPAESRQLVERVAKHFGVESADGKGKLDVAASLGLLRFAAGRHSLTAHGRAILDLDKNQGPTSTMSRAFYLRRVVQNDADYSLTLLLTIARFGPKFTRENFATALDHLLVTKWERVEESEAPLTLRRLADQTLRVAERKPAKTPIERMRIAHDKKIRAAEAGAYSRIELAGKELETWVRHTVDPRKGWLVDLLLTEKSPKGHALADGGQSLAEFLTGRTDGGEGYAIIDVEPGVLRGFAFMDHLLTNVTVNEEYWDSITSMVYAGKPPQPISLGPSEFLDLLRGPYEVMKLEHFQQAEASGVRELVQVPLLVTGRRLDFTAQLRDLVKQFPGKVSRIASPTDEAAYISIRG